MAVVNPGSSDFHLLVHRFSRCSSRGEAYSTDHLKLETFERPVEPGQAIALSYGIGDFNRQYHLFGHVSGDESEPVRLEFGGEWELEGLMNALVALSEKHGAIWLDQLSIPQDEASKDFHLQRMPQIYRMFEVVVLLPNAPCPCLEEALTAWTARRAWAWQEGAAADGDFNLVAVAGTCLNAFPVSSYYFRLWTKLEFAYAGAISIHYCGAPGGRCSLGNHDWLYKTTVIPTRPEGHLGRWASWKYGECVNMSQGQGEYVEEMAWSMFRDAHIMGRDHLLAEVAHFIEKRNMDLFFATRSRIYAELARFVLGERLERRAGEHEDLFRAEHFNSEHVVTKQKDFALAVLPSFGEYKIPFEHKKIKLPQLVENGIEQYDVYKGSRNLTKLPKGLFEFGIGSMRCKPTLYLREEDIRCLGDVYGSLQASTFQRLVSRDMTMLRLRNAAQPPASRMAESMTYHEAFGDAETTTSDVCEFIRKIVKIKSGSFGRSRVSVHKAWASAIIRDKFTIHLGGWPSKEHEQAIFEEAIRYDWPWGSWPKIDDHESVCYELMCSYVCIQPRVARENNLQLVVKTSSPPCIGLVNGAFVKDQKRVKRQRIRVSELWEGEKTVGPEDWLTILVNVGPDLTAASAVLTLEAVKVYDHFNMSKMVTTAEDRHQKTVPCYHVVGVWFSCRQDDPSIGAELIKNPVGMYDAVLV